MIIDTHAHIDQIEDLAGALTRASEAGVSDIVAMSVDLASMQKLLGIAKEYETPKIHVALGIHPGKVDPQTQAITFKFMEDQIKHATAVGETGLDYWYKWVRSDHVERNKQKESFQFHLELSRKFDLPIVIHSRGAWRDCLEMALQAGVTRALFHWYSGPIDILNKIIDAGFYVSTSPSVGYSPQSREAMQHAPLERILIETDSPVYYKEGEEGYMAEPRHVIKTWKFLSQLKNTDETETLNVVNSNAKSFFRINS